MEKYRKFSDAATGINPFTISRNPTLLSLSIAAILFPLRLVLALVFILLILAVDLLVYIFYMSGLSFVSRHLLACLQRLLLRGLLFSLGNLRVARGEPKAMRRTAAPVSLRAGDLVLANMQSLWDMCVLEIAAELPLATVAFYIGHVTDSPETRWGVKGGGASSSLCVFEPSPLQRWHVWSHVCRTGSLDFLSRATDGVSGSPRSNKSNTHHRSNEEAGAVDISALQYRSAGLGVPLVLFAEGSCTNGKGILRIPELHTATEPARTFVAAVDYDTPALHTIVRHGNICRSLFAMSAQLHGSRDPAWSSPALPVATVCMAATRNGTGTNIAEMRQALCAASRARRPLAVGLQEKRGYVSEYLSTSSL